MCVRAFLSLFLIGGVYQLCETAPRFKIDGICKLPRGDFCTEIRKCPFFADLLDSTSKPRPREVIKIIRDHQCGFHGNTPKVCCRIPVTTTTTTTSTTTELSPAFFRKQASIVMSHRNLHLLPREDCGLVSNGFRIIGGARTALLEFPWMALIAYMTNDGLEFRCGGTVINERYVLTAAHCILNLNIIGVRLGEYNINTQTDCDETNGKCAPPVQDFYIEDIIMHPEYIENTFTNDIALIRLATPANFTSNVQPICLPIAPMESYDLDGKFAVISGWGITESGYKSTELLKTSVPVVPISECRILYHRYAPISNKQLCAGGYLGRDSCGGDSGGPLKRVSLVDGSLRYVQHGIVSYGPRHCGTDGQPGVYTRVSYYMKWILDNMKPSD